MAAKKTRRQGGRKSEVTEGKPAGRTAADRTSGEAEEPKVKKPGNGWRSERQQRLTLEYAKRTVWANLQGIVEAAIRQSLSCNYNAAKFLLEFGQVAEMPEPEEAVEEETTQNAGSGSEGGPMAWFFDRLGIKPAVIDPDQMVDMKGSRPQAAGESGVGAGGGIASGEPKLGSPGSFAGNNGGGLSSDASAEVGVIA